MLLQDSCWPPSPKAVSLLWNKAGNLSLSIRETATEVGRSCLPWSFCDTSAEQNAQGHSGHEVPLLGSCPGERKLVPHLTFSRALLLIWGINFNEQIIEHADELKNGQRGRRA